MKEGWTYKKLGEVCVDKKQIVRASNLFLPNEIINYIDISSIDNSQNVITSTTPIIFDDAPSRAQQVVNIGDVLISLVRPNLRNVAIVNSQNDNLVASSGFCILRTEGHANNRYIFYIVKGDKFTNYLRRRKNNSKPTTNSHSPSSTPCLATPSTIPKDGKPRNWERSQRKNYRMAQVHLRYNIMER